MASAISGGLRPGTTRRAVVVKLPFWPCPKLELAEQTLMQHRTQDIMQRAHRRASS